MKAKVYSIEGKPVRDIEISDRVFQRGVHNDAIYHAVNAELTRRRRGTSSTKTRAEVHGSNAKPWPQKGTGRARAGDRKSPIWVGGGIAFGPRPRHYTYKIPKKVKRLAYCSILSMKTDNEKLKVVEDFSIESGKTRDLVKIMKNFVGEERTVVIIGSDDNMLRRAGKNIPWLHFQSFNRLSAHDLFYGRNIIVLESAATKLGEFFADGKAEGKGDENGS